MKQIKLFEAFAGIGAQYKALKNIAKENEWEIKVVGIVEWFIPAIIAYNKLHNNSNIKIIERERETYLEYSYSLDSKKPAANNKAVVDKYFSDLYISKELFNNTFDISKTTYHQVAKNIDIFTYSFPCQDLSNQGKQKGMKKGSNTRSGLLWEIERILSEMKQNWKDNELPKYLLLENVVQIGNKNNISQLNQWIDKLDELGYETKMYYLNSSNFNSPQNRLRAYGLSVRKDWKNKVNFSFKDLESMKQNKKKAIKTILDKTIDKKTLLPNIEKYKRTQFKLTANNIYKSKLINYTNFSSENYIYHIDYTGPTLTASGANSRIKILQDNKIRQLSAKEAIRYMGFDVSDFLKIKAANINDTRIIYLAGNSISIQVLENIFKGLKF